MIENKLTRWLVSLDRY